MTNGTTVSTGVVSKTFGDKYNIEKCKAEKVCLQIVGIPSSK